MTLLNLIALNLWHFLITFWLALIFNSRAFALNINRPFAVHFNPYNQSIETLSNAQSIANALTDLRGNIYIIIDALKKLKQENDSVQKKGLMIQRMESALRNLNIDSFNVN